MIWNYLFQRSYLRALSSANAYISLEKTFCRLYHLHKYQFAICLTDLQDTYYTFLPKHYHKLEAPAAREFQKFFKEV